MGVSFGKHSLRPHNLNPNPNPNPNPSSFARERFAEARRLGYEAFYMDPVLLKWISWSLFEA